MKRRFTSLGDITGENNENDIPSESEYETDGEEIKKIMTGATKKGKKKGKKNNSKKKSHCNIRIIIYKGIKPGRSKKISN